MCRLPSIFLLVLLPCNFALAQATAKGARTDAHGDPLPDGTIARLGTARLRHLDAVTSLAFSPDGKLLATAGYDKVVRLWETSSGKAAGRFGDLGRGPVVGGFRADGKLLLVATDEGWTGVDVATGKRRWVAKGAELLDVAPDGAMTARVQDATVQLVDPTTDRAIARFPGKATALDRLRFSPDGTRLAQANTDGVRILDVAGRKEVAQLHGAALGETGDGPPVQFSPDGKLVAVLRGKALRLWDPTTGREVRAFPEHEHDISSFGFDGTGTHLLSACSDRSAALVIRRWDVATGKETAKLSFPQFSLFAVAPNGRTVAVAHGPLIELWDVLTGKRAVPAGLPGPAVSLSWSPDSKRLATGGHDYQVWDVADARSLFTIPSRELNSVCVFSPDGKLLAVPDRPGAGNPKAARSIGLYETASGKEVRRLTTAMERVCALAFAPDGQSLASGHEKIDVARGEKRPFAVTLRLWNVNTGDLRQTVSTVNVATRSVAYLADGKKLAAGNHQVHFVDAGSGRIQGTVPAPGTILQVNPAPDGQTLGVLNEEGLSLWSVASASRLAAIPNAGAFAFSPDGQVLMMRVGDGTLAFWDVATGKRIFDVVAHESPISALAAAPNGQYLATAGTDATVLVWDLPALWAARLGPFRDADNAALWKDLGSDDTKVAYRAVQALVRKDGGTDFLRAQVETHVKARAPLEVRVRRLVQELDSERFQTRATAAQELRQVGGPAEHALRRALLGTPSAEFRRAAEEFLSELKPHEASEGALRGETLRLHRALQVLGALPTADSEAALKLLATALPSLREGHRARLVLEASSSRPSTNPK